MKPPEYFRMLAERTEQAWAKSHFDERVLPQVAVRILSELRATDYLNLDEAFEWFLTCHAGEVPAQRDPHVWVPMLTVRTGRRFYIGLYVWLDSTTEIHCHGFAGAFQVVSGSSVHTAYTFDHGRRLNGHCHLGELRPRALDILRPGDTLEISPGTEYIHSLYHVDRPSCTIIIRTEPSTGCAPELRFLPPGVAVDAHLLDRPCEAILKRRLQLAECLVRCQPDPAEAILRLMKQWDATTTFFVLTSVVADEVRRTTRDPTEAAALLDPFVAVLREQDCAFGDATLAAVLESLRRERLHGCRTRVRNPALRRLLGLLLSGADASMALRALARFGVPDPAASALSGLEQLEDLPNLAATDLAPFRTAIEHMARGEPAANGASGHAKQR